MRVMGTLYITDHRARVRLRKGTVVVEQPSGWQRIPIESLDGVLLTSRAEITNGAIGELVRRGVRIAALSRTGRLRFAVGGPVSGNVHLRLAQFSQAHDPSTVSMVSRLLVAGKLQNCRQSIKRWLWDASGTERWILERELDAISDRVRELAGADDGDRIRGLEGDGSRRYFKCMGAHLGSAEPVLSFERRSRRPPRDPVNALLGFVYGVLLAELVGALDAVGLDPQIGFLHRPRSGRPALALDLLEEFRPSVADRFAVGVLKRRQVRGEHFRVVGQGCYLNDTGRATVLSLYEAHRCEEVEHRVLGRQVGRWALPTVQAALMARYLRGDIPSYPPFVQAA